MTNLPSEVQNLLTQHQEIQKQISEKKKEIAKLTRQKENLGWSAHTISEQIHQIIQILILVHI